MLIPISNEPRSYAWGAPDLIARLQGRDSDGAPEAEVWFGDHPGSPALVEDGTGRTLDALLRDRGDAPLPFLLKLLAAGSSLSIQAHPSKAEAETGFAREEADGIARDAADRTYRDDNHKPEIIVALSDEFRALVGLRPLADTRRLLAALGDRAGVRALAARVAGDDEPGVLRAAIGAVLSGEATAEVADVTAALAEADDVEFAGEIAVLRRIAADFPGDAGIVVALLMNLVVLRRGEALFAPAGVLHAYQDGLGVELMAASDNVLRGGLTPKHVDVPELLRIVDTVPAAAPRVQPGGAGPVTAFRVGIPDFSLLRADTRAGAARIVLAGPTIVLAVAGEVTVTAGERSCVLRAGQAAFATADERDLTLTGAGEAFIAQPG